MYKPTRIFNRLNLNITAPTVRLIDESGKQVGILSREEALRKARDLEVDLVEVAPNANPPVCRLIDYKKFQYLQSRKEREEKKKTKTVDLKGIRMGPFVASHDLQTRLDRMREFLTEGDRVKVTVRFTGRQMAHPQFGYDLLKKVVEEVKDIGHVEREAKFEGRNLIMILGKIKGREKEVKDAKSENQKSSGKAL
ncbi:MAG: translation initiation factor IF-3 [bacterium]|nr:translation initiation factor IF-3 [bacterium]